MQIKQAELKSITLKSLVSLDKSIRLVIDVNLDNNLLDINQLKEFLYKPLVLDINEDKNYGKT